MSCRRRTSPSRQVKCHLVQVGLRSHQHYRYSVDVYTAPRQDRRKADGIART
ncbi:hypothetical protein BDU57DRAFT_521604 [Ampelomyces quisqualis]|uniref:Uncharacterized protein n=1 Tax=Ampelomyces quisqualis TaxID=50730 RepID=A0A6A5QDU8_AMPQU|nr:hypothetical protein BDU57DRAFT_521604 [Ampelomyces quisqualis]